MNLGKFGKTEVPWFVILEEEKKKGGGGGGGGSGEGEGAFWAKSLESLAISWQWLTVPAVIKLHVLKGNGWEGMGGGGELMGDKKEDVKCI